MDELETAISELFKMVSVPASVSKERTLVESPQEPVETPREPEATHVPEDAEIPVDELVGALERDLDTLKMNMGIKATPLVTKRMAKGVNLDGGADKSIKTLTVEAFEELYTRIQELSPTLHPRDRAVLTEFLMGQIVEMAQKSFYIYVKYMAHHILPEGFIDGRHIKLMADELQKVEHATFIGKPIRQAIYCPPGAMKSKINNLFISWVLGRHPKWNILHIGHGTKFVEDNAGRPIRDLMRTAEYLRIFPDVKIKIDSRAAGRWELTKGGRYYGAGVGTQIAGRRAHISICDDVVSEQSAYSIVERRAINAWYVPGLRTRLLPNGSEIIVNTRWVVDDLSGYLENNDAKSKRPWNVIKIPAILDAKAAKLLGLPEGESFWPEFQPLEFLQERKNDPSMTASKWSALYMQEPIPEEGSIFKEDDFQMWTGKKPPDVDLVILSLDTAYSIKTSADYSAYSVWGVFMQNHIDNKGRPYTIPNLILIECDKKRWEYPELVNQVKEMNEYYKPDIILVENKASGQSLIPELRLMGYPVVDFNPNEWGDKIMRANQVTTYFRNGRIWVPDSQDFTSTLVRDALEFPFGPSDDLVDTMTQAIIYLRQSMALSTSDHMSENTDPDDEDFHRKRKTYWNSAAAA